MVHAAMPLQAVSGSPRLAKAREKFLAAEPVSPHEVREPILASWRRSRDWRVAADRIDLRYTRDPDPETALARHADPVLRHLHEQLDGQPISIILTDANGLVLTRLTADHDLERHLDGVKLAPGFNYSEELVGTNGIGTALEAGRPTHVFGHEHYAEHLEGLACAGVPIHHPITGKTVGVIDLTCWRKNADPLLVALVKNTADQVTQALLNGSSGREFNLLEEYVRACRRTGGIVLAIGNDVVMMNDYARRILDPADQAALIGQAAEVLARRHAGAVTAELPTGLKARMYCRPIGEASPFGDGIVHVKLLDAVARPPAAPGRRAPGPRCSCPAWSARGRCGRGPAATPSSPTTPPNGWPWRVSRVWARWPWPAPSTSGTTQRAGSTSSTRRMPAPTGWSPRAANCWTARACW